MIGFVGRRFTAVVFQIILVTFIAYALFFLVSTATGATPEQRVAGRTATPEQVARVAEILGTDRPIYVHRRGSNVANGEYYWDHSDQKTLAHYGAWRKIDVGRSVST
jgi:hypothetical protein